MRGGPAALALLIALATARAGAQGPDAVDVPPGDGVVRGRIVHPAGPGAAAGLPVVLYAMPSSGEPGVRSSEADGSGAFRFEGVSRDPTTAYLVGTRFGEVPFGARFAFAPDEREHRVSIAVSEATADASQAIRGEVQLRVSAGCDGLRVLEVHELRNPGESVVYVPAGEREARVPVMESALPSAARDFDAPFANVAEGLVREGDRVRFWGPLYPGSQELSFGYALPADAGGVALSRAFPRGAERVLLLLPEGGPEPRDARPALAPAGERSLDGVRYRALASGAIAPGAALSLHFELPPQADPAALGFEEVQLWLDLDGAALAVDEVHHIRVSGDAPLEAPGAAPLVCLPLPPDAEGLRFSPSTIELGLASDPSGALAIRGPIPAGTSELALRYRVPNVSEPLVFRRRFGRLLPLLSVLVADTGLRVDSERLHRRRPMRTSDRSFLRLEGFGIGPGEEVSLRLSPLGGHGGPAPHWAAAAMGLVAVVCAGFLMAPLRRRRAQAAQPLPDSATRVEREGVYAAIDDLDDDLETGKLSPEDHAALRAELRARAVALLAEERAASPAPAHAAPAPARRCGACGAAPAAADRFCAQCGARLEGGPGPAA